MMRLIPDTIAGRTLLALLAGLFVSHAVSMTLYVTDRANAVNLVGGEHTAQRMLTVARIVKNASLSERSRLLRLADEPGFRISLTTQREIEGTPPGNWQTDVLRRSFAVHLGKSGMKDFTLRYRPSEKAGSSVGEKTAGGADGTKSGLLEVSLQLPDQTWLNFRATVGPPESIWSIRFILSIVVMAVTTVLLSIFVVYHLTRSLRVFSRAAYRLGTDVRTPNLPEFGPREVRETIRAFNEMQRRIRRLVEDRTQMLSAISHDLRTPITLLRLRAEFIENEEERSKMLKTLGEMEGMIASILTFARGESEKEEPRVVDLEALLASLCEDMREAGLPVEFESTDKLAYECRPIAIKRALTNLIENAVKYGGRAHVRLMADERSARILVEDEGPGIPEDEMEKVLAPFYRMERSRSQETGGTGLGLTVAKAMIAANGGEIRLENRPEGGLRVIVNLPR